MIIKITHTALNNLFAIMCKTKGIGNLVQSVYKGKLYTDCTRGFQKLVKELAQDRAVNHLHIEQ